MKKFTILSPLVLLATTALAQDSTCILQPSCSRLGYTKSDTECGDQNFLRCPFDDELVACIGGKSGTGGGAGGDDYNPYDPNDELGDVIALVIDKTATGNIDFTYGGGNIMVDCGNGTIVGGSASSSGTVSCSYPELGKYTVKLSGSFTYYGGASGSPTTLLKLDKSGITKMSKVCGSSTNGVVPPLPSTLKDATNMFTGCTNINSPYPKLPDGLEIADYMFASTSNTSTSNASDGNMKFSGDVELPSSLKSAIAMFNCNNKLNAVTGSKDTQITNANAMFRKSSISSIDGLPNTLTKGAYMFYQCVSLTTLPNLPDSLTDGDSMFYQCRNMTGTLNALPSSLTCGIDMFAAASNVTGSPAKPVGFADNCRPNQPREGSCYGIFSYTGVEVDWY